jgi:hypothetical protein
LKEFVSNPSTPRLERVAAIQRIESRCRDHGTWLLEFSRKSGLDHDVAVAAYTVGSALKIAFGVKSGVETFRADKRRTKAWLRRHF